MKMKMPDNSIGGSSSNSYNHVNINAAPTALRNNGGGGGDGDGGGHGSAYYSDPSYDSDADSVGSHSNEESSGPVGDDFAEYMWMENEDEFDEQELQRLEEEELMDQCIEAMMLDEMAAAERMAGAALMGNVPRESGLMNILSSLQHDKEQQQLLALQAKNVNVETSTLNPLAAEFVPSLRSLVAPIPY